jgi:anti-sigma factor ChrR (cupin superfamily)
MEEITMNASEMTWETEGSNLPGLLRKVLRRSAEGEPRTALLKLQPGFEMDEHAHVHLEQHYVIEGEYESQGRRYPAGSYRLIPGHANHGPFRSAQGALILVMWE